VSRKAYYLAELNRTGVTRVLLWQEYIRADPTGYGYAKFCEVLAEQMLPDNASFHMTYEPGALMMVDFAGDKISYIDRSTGASVECPVFVCVLPYSGYSYVIALRDEKIPNVIKALNASVAYFEGLPLGAKCDNMRTAVIKSCKYEPVFTEVFEQWALSVPKGNQLDYKWWPYTDDCNLYKNIMSFFESIASGFAFNISSMR